MDLGNPLRDTRGDTSNLAQKSFISYEIYSNKNLYFTKMQKEAFNANHSYFVTETSFFKPDSGQIQICSATRYPDTRNDLSDSALQRLFDDVALSRKHAGQVNNETGYSALNISLQIEYKFVRPGPDLKEEASIQINRTLDYTKYDDCRAGEELAAWRTARLDCGTEEDFSRVVYVRQAFNPKLALGRTRGIDPIVAKATSKTNQMHDMKLTLECKKGSRDLIFTVDAKRSPTVFTNEEEKARKVDPKTCELLNSDYGSELEERYIDGDASAFVNEYDPLGAAETAKELTSTQDTKRILLTKVFEQERTNDEGFTNWTVYLFNLEIMAGFLAGMSAGAFYLTVTYACYGVLQPLFRSYMSDAVMEQLCKPRALLKLCEAVHLHRHEENLVAEEECFAMLNEILRCPELLRAITGSRARGSVSPELDGLSKKQRDKLKHLDTLQAKGFDVDVLKE